MPFAIRPATDADVPNVLPMVQAVCDYHRTLEPQRYAFVADVTARYESWLRQRAADPASVLLVAEEAGAAELLGFVVGETLDEIPVFEVKRYGFIHDLWVEPIARNRSVGTRLVAETVARFASMGLTQVRGDTAWANTASRSMLAQLGFAPTTVQVLKHIGRPNP